MIEHCSRQWGAGEVRSSAPANTVAAKKAEKFHVVTEAERAELSRISDDVEIWPDATDSAAMSEAWGYHSSASCSSCSCLSLAVVPLRHHRPLAFSCALPPLSSSAALLFLTLSLALALFSSPLPSFLCCTLRRGTQHHEAGAFCGPTVGEHVNYASPFLDT